MTPTIPELVAWVLKHRGDSCFRGWSARGIRRVLLRSIALGGFFLIRSAAGTVAGVAVGFPDHPRRTLQVVQLLTVIPCLPEFLPLFRQRFGGYTILAHRWRRGQRVPVVYKTQRLCQLLEAAT